MTDDTRGARSHLAHIGALREAMRAGDEAAIEALYPQIVEASFRDFMLVHRKRMGHPLTEQERALAAVAHAHGFCVGGDVVFAANTEEDG